MLTIQPNLVNSYSKAQAFGNGIDDEYVDFVEVPNRVLEENPDSFESEIHTADVSEDYQDSFDFDREKAEAKKELDLWKQTKQNIDSIAKTTESVTESVPAVKTGMKIFSGLISVAIGWGGLRWGSVGTLEVLSKLGESRLAKAFKGYGESTVELFNKGIKAVTGAGWYKSMTSRVSGWKDSFLQTGLGTTLTNWKRSITSNSKYIKMVDAKNNAVDYVKNINPKRVFVETMGVAGGGTAAVNTLGGKSVDGVKHNVEREEDGSFTIDGRRALEHKGDLSNVA